jgi:hypothetical protein
VKKKGKEMAVSTQSRSKLKKRKADSIELSEDNEGANGPVVLGAAQFKLLMSQLASNQAKTDAAQEAQTKLNEAFANKMLVLSRDNKETIVGPAIRRPSRKRGNQMLCTMFRRAVRKLVRANVVEVKLQLHWNCTNPAALELMDLLAVQVVDYYSNQPAIAGTHAVYYTRSTPYTSHSYTLH